MPRESSAGSARTAGGGSRRAKKPALMERCAGWVYAHKVVSGIGIGVIALAVFCLIFWFSIFSGLSSSADFIYSKF